MFNEKVRKRTILNNALFILKKQYYFNKKSLIAPITRIVSGVFVSLLTIMLPKIILDSLENNLTIEDFLIKIIPIIVFLSLASYSDYCSNISMKRWADCMRYTCYVKEINDKAIKQNYDIFISTEGKNKRKKAELSVGYSGSSGLNNFMLSLTELTKNILGFLSYCAIISVLNPWIIVLMSSCYAIYYLVYAKYEKWLHKNKTQRAEIYRKLNYMAYRTRTLSALKDIKMYGMASWINEVSQTILERVYQLYYDIEQRKYALLLLGGILTFLCNGLAYIYLIHLILINKISIGSFVIFFAAISGFGDWLQNIISIGSELIEANYYVEDYRDYVDMKDEVNENDRIDISDISKPYTIILENVSYQYPESEKIILENINLEIKNCEKLAIVGSNGAGKTTLVNIICGLLAPTKGRVLLNGIDIREIDKNQYKDLITALFQDIGVIPASISKNIALCIDEKIDENKVWQCLKMAGLSEKIKDLPNGIYTNLVKNVADNAVELSKGEMQKMLLARAMYKNHQIIILDEPTASLDPIAENEVYLKYNIIARNKIAIFISHRLSSTKFCDRIIFLKDSKIIETGTHSDLMQKGGEYARVFNLQSYYYNNYDLEEAEKCLEFMKN